MLLFYFFLLLIITLKRSVAQLISCSKSRNISGNDFDIWILSQMWVFRVFFLWIKHLLRAFFIIDSSFIDLRIKKWIDQLQKLIQSQMYVLKLLQGIFNWLWNTLSSIPMPLWPTYATKTISEKMNYFYFATEPVCSLEEPLVTFPKSMLFNIDTIFYGLMGVGKLRNAQKTPDCFLCCLKTIAVRLYFYSSHSVLNILFLQSDLERKHWKLGETACLAPSKCT